MQNFLRNGRQKFWKNFSFCVFPFQVLLPVDVCMKNTLKILSHLNCRNLNLPVLEAKSESCYKNTVKSTDIC